MPLSADSESETSLHFWTTGPSDGLRLGRLGLGLRRSRRVTRSCWDGPDNLMVTTVGHCSRWLAGRLSACSEAGSFHCRPGPVEP
eukprot:1080852-Rhodomonas_salina.1